ncbi:myozenin-3 [Suncus etruscus]|uniref:myozenin-3 n=1 Tax=Suncus etruscus TaxID=109475 RepID=UPI00210F8257|nr:myozenin-3 [Suncus etruscus]
MVGEMKSSLESLTSRVTAIKDKIKVPLLNLGKKLSVPQDLMMEELSLHNNRGSLLFQKRQRRVQKFTFEYAASQQEVLTGGAQEKVTGRVEQRTVANGPEEQTYLSDLHNFKGSPGNSQLIGPMKDAYSPSALAPGYAEPLKGVPPEKFNHTAIPKGYHCPWQEMGSSRHFQSYVGGHIPHPASYRNFNKTPSAPLEDPWWGISSPKACTPLHLSELTSGLEFLRLRPSFQQSSHKAGSENLPESEEL